MAELHHLLPLECPVCGNFYEENEGEKCLIHGEKKSVCSADCLDIVRFVTANEKTIAELNNISNRTKRMEVRQKIVRRRNAQYRLNALVRKQGFVLDTKIRTIYCQHDKPLPECPRISRLIKEFGYCIQLCIC